MTDTTLKNLTVPVIGFVGYSGSGKTTLLVRIISEFHTMGIRTAVIKHAHHTIDIDTPGKDSYRLRQAGATQAIVASKHRWALMVETPVTGQEPSLVDLLMQLDHTKLDVVFVEGFKHSAYPKIEINRSVLNNPLLYPEDQDIIALVTDQPYTSKKMEKITILDIDDPQQITQFIVRTIGIKND